MLAKIIKKSKGIVINVRIAVTSIKGRRGLNQEGKMGTSDLLASLIFFWSRWQDIVIYFIIFVKPCI